MRKGKRPIHALLSYLVHRPSLASMSAIWDNALPFLEQVFKTDLSKFEVSKGHEGLKKWSKHSLLTISLSTLSLSRAHTTARHGHHQDVSTMESKKEETHSIRSGAYHGA